MSKEKYKIPLSKEVEIINKWRALDLADRDLAMSRRQYHEYINDYIKRWKVVETSQKNLKQNLVKFNNFVREKQGKVADSISFVLIERQKQAKLERMIKKIVEEKNQLAAANAFLQDHIKVKELYKKYLDSVYSIGSGEFNQVDDVIKRSQALFENKSMLRDQLDCTMKKQEEIDNNLEDFRHSKLKSMIELNIKLVDLQKEADSNTANIKMSMRTRDNMEEVSSEKRMTISNIKLAIQNISRQVRLTGERRRTSEDTNRPSLDYQLDRIKAHIEDLKLVQHRVLLSDETKFYYKACPSSETKNI